MPAKKQLQLNKKQTVNKKRTAVQPRISIILLGEPGAGKATQAAYFAKKYNMFDFDMGRELTLLREKDKQVSDSFAKNYDKGKLAPTQMVRNIILEKFAKLPKSKNILFDGFPKMLGEARIVNKLLQQSGRDNVIFLYLTIPEEEVIKRVLHRKGYADTKFSKRLHDTEDGLKNRAKYYKVNIKQVKQFFKKFYPFYTIDGLGTRTEVRRRMQKVIDKHL